MSLNITDLTNMNTKVEVKEEIMKQNFFINKYDLEENIEYLKVAYVKKIILAKSQIDTTYAKIILVDRDGGLLSGIMFNLDSVQDLGKTVLSLEGKLVKVHYMVEIYQNRPSLKIESLTAYKEKVISLEEYFRPIPNLNEMYKELLNRLESVKEALTPLCDVIKRNNLIKILYKASTDLWYGRKGGALKLTYKTIERIKSIGLEKNYQDDGKYLEDKLILLTIVSIYLEVKRVREQDMIDNRFDLELGTSKVLSIHNKFWDIVTAEFTNKNRPTEYAEDLKREGSHLFYVMLGTVEPKMYSSVMIRKALADVKEEEALTLEYMNMMNNSLRHIGDKDIIKLGGI